MEKTLVVILGPHAVGKMTVGQVLAERTGLRLFHNHMSIELTRKLFAHAEPEWRILNETIRQTVFRLFAEGDFSGLIFTYMFAFDMPSEYTYLRNLTTLFEENGAKCCVVELSADFDVRLERNRSENRLRNKESKRDLERSESEMRHTGAAYRLNSLPEDVLPYPNYLKLDNTHMEPTEVARRIMEHFDIASKEEKV